MKIKSFVLGIIGLGLSAGLWGADRLAVAEPIGKGGVAAQDIEAFWGMLESSIMSDDYELVSRGALKQMMTEIGLTTSSNLVSLNDDQKARLGQLATVKYILVSEIGTFGSRLNCTLRILDSSTGVIDPRRRENLRVADLDELADKLESTLERLFSDQKQLMRSAVLAPIIRFEAGPQQALIVRDEFPVQLRDGLLSNGVRLQNLTSVDKILKANNLGDLSECEPSLYRKVGKLLGVQHLIQPVITRFDLTGVPYHVEETGAHGTWYVGNIAGNVQVVSAQTGEIVCALPFEDALHSRTLGRAATRGWTPADYGRALIRTILPKLVPVLLAKAPALKGE